MSNTKEYKDILKQAISLRKRIAKMNGDCEHIDAFIEDVRGKCIAIPEISEKALDKYVPLYTIDADEKIIRIMGDRDTVRNALLVAVRELHEAYGFSSWETIDSDTNGEVREFFIDVVDENKNSVEFKGDNYYKEAAEYLKLHYPNKKYDMEELHKKGCCNILY